MDGRRLEAVLAELEEHLHANQVAEDQELFQILKARLLARAISRPAGNPVVAPSPERRTLIGSLRQIFGEHPDRTWTIVSLRNELRRRGFEIPAVHPRSSLNTTLRRLKRDGFIVSCKKGAGRRPSRYAAFPNGNSAALRGRYAAIADPAEASGSMMEEGTPVPKIRKSDSSDHSS
jgi:hypothetical protein